MLIMTFLVSYRVFASNLIDLPNHEVQKVGTFLNVTNIINLQNAFGCFIFIRFISNLAKYLNDIMEILLCKCITYFQH
jgi:hypothetical protein